MHIFGWFYYYMWLTWHDSCDLCILVGCAYLTLQGLSRWTGIHEDITCSDLHGALEPKDGCRDPTYGASL
jgi:hypothetical protein